MLANFQQRLAQRFPALASRDFFIFWVGQFLSLIGSWMQSTTLPYLAYKLSGRPFDLGLIGFAATLPTLFLALPGGVLVERMDKRKTVIAMQAVMMLQAASLGILAITGLINIWQIFILTLILGTANAIEITARQAMLIELVGKPALPNAIALQATIFNAARLIGPMAVTPFLVLIENQGEGLAFLVNAFSYLIVIVGLFMVQTPFKSAEPSAKRNLMLELREGQKYIIDTPAISTLILMSALIGLVGFPFIQQIPAVARDVLAQAGDTSASVAARNSALYIAQGIGALIASVILAAFNPRRKGLLLLLGQLAFITSMLFVGFTTSTPIAFILLILIGWGTVTQLATMNTLIQLEVPNQLRGRVFSTYLWALQGIAPFGSLLVGWMAQNWGVPVAIRICAITCLVGIGSIHLAAPWLRKKEDAQINPN